MLVTHARICCKLETLERSGDSSLSLKGQQAPLGLVFRPLSQAAPPLGPLCLATLATPLAQPLDGGGRGSGRM